MKTKINKMSIKRQLSNYIPMVLVLSMVVCVGCKKEPMLSPKSLSSTYNEVVDERQMRFGRGPDQASAKTSTPQNQRWFHDLIELNPGAAIYVELNGFIIVTNPPEVPLVLPKGGISGVPADVELSSQWD